MHIGNKKGKFFPASKRFFVSTAFHKKSIWVFWVLIPIAAGNMLPVSAADKYREMINCDIHQTACTQILSDRKVTLEIRPKPVKAMHDLVFKVTLTGTPTGKTALPYIDLGMPGMKMGPNRVLLKPAGDGVYEGQGIIVRCPSGRRIWQATITVPQLGKADFVFDVIY